MRFDKIILIGSGKIAGDCLKCLLHLVEKEKLVVMETSDSSLSMLESICRQEGLAYEAAATGRNPGGSVPDKKQTEQHILNNISGFSSLIISANNRFIFTPEIIHSTGTEIINFHYALLPHYRGMNIPTWVIFNGEKQTGITWHYVNEEIDRGNIIAQKAIDIGPSTTAFDITRRGMALALEAFEEFIGELLERHLEEKKVEYPEDEPVYRSSVLPMDGMLDLQQPIKDMVRLLHSYDYRGMEVVPKLQTEYRGKRYRIEKYREKEPGGGEKIMEMRENKLRIRAEGREILLFLKQLPS